MKLTEYDYITSLVMLDENMPYTGKEIEPLWAYKKFNIQKDSIVIFKGPINVSVKDMKDLKDIKEESKYGDILIKSDNAINIIVEHFDNINLKTTYLRQRLLVYIVKETLEEYSNKRIIKKGDDLYYNTGKISVSIACKGVSSSKIHLGINITTNGTPSYLKISSLNDLLINNTNIINNIMNNIAKLYCEEINKIEYDIRKTQSI